jgi:hypoxanthine phosphoribosyltransferase
MTGRIFDHAFAWQMTPRQLTAAASLLAGAARSQFGPIDQVIAVERGGIEPARAISSQLGSRMHTIRARHNPTSDPYTQATGQVWCTASGLPPDAVNGCVLIVDDICGTGATLRVVTSILRELAGDDPGTRLHTATLCRNAGAYDKPGLTVWDDLREWVIFPWEPRPQGGTTLRTLPDPTQARAA